MTIDPAKLKEWRAACEKLKGIRFTVPHGEMGAAFWTMVSSVPALLAEVERLTDLLDETRDSASARIQVGTRDAVQRAEVAEREWAASKSQLQAAEARVRELEASHFEHPWTVNDAALLKSQLAALQARSDALAEAAKNASEVLLTVASNRRRYGAISTHALQAKHLLNGPLSAWSPEREGGR